MKSEHVNETAAAGIRGYLEALSDTASMLEETADILSRGKAEVNDAEASAAICRRIAGRIRSACEFATGEYSLLFGSAPSTEFPGMTDEPLLVFFRGIIAGKMEMRDKDFSEAWHHAFTGGGKKE